VSEIEKLLLVQEHDLKIRDIQKTLQDIPATKSAESDRLESHRQALKEAEERVKHAQADVKKLELDCEAGRERITKYRQQQMQLKTNKEFQTMESEITGVRQQIAQVEDRELSAMEALEKARAEADAKKTALDAEDVLVRKDVADLDERLGSLEKRLKDLKDMRAKVAVGVDPEWLRTYERILTRRDRAVVPLQQGMCGGCHMSQPPTIIHQARRRTTLVSCLQCGRLVY
jgi:uncharacterized protein